VEQQAVEISSRTGDLYDIGGPLTRQGNAACGPSGRQAYRYGFSTNGADGIGESRRFEERDTDQRGGQGR
jgi:hypothetical protein